MTLALIPAGCDFAALDVQPVRIIAMIAAPAQNRPRYLHILSTVAGELNNPQVRERMVAAQDPAQVVAAFLLR